MFLSIRPSLLTASYLSVLKKGVPIRKPFIKYIVGCDLDRLKGYHFTLITITVSNDTILINIVTVDVHTSIKLFLNVYSV